MGGNYAVSAVSKPVTTVSVSVKYAVCRHMLWGFCRVTFIMWSRSPRQIS